LNYLSFYVILHPTGNIFQFEVIMINTNLQAFGRGLQIKGIYA